MDGVTAASRVSGSSSVSPPRGDLPTEAQLDVRTPCSCKQPRLRPRRLPLLGDITFVGGLPALKAQHDGDFRSEAPVTIVPRSSRSLLDVTVPSRRLARTAPCPRTRTERQPRVRIARVTRRTRRGRHFRRRSASAQRSSSTPSARPSAVSSAPGNQLSVTPRRDTSSEMLLDVARRPRQAKRLGSRARPAMRGPISEAASRYATPRGCSGHQFTSAYTKIYSAWTRPKKLHAGAARDLDRALTFPLPTQSSTETCASARWRRKRRPRPPAALARMRGSSQVRFRLTTRNIRRRAKSIW